MATKEYSLELEPRTKTGTGASNQLRAAGRVPAVLYGHGSTPQHVSVETRALEELLAHGGRSHILTLMMEGAKADTAMVRDVRRHQVTHKIEHVDLQRVSKNEAIRASVGIVTVGTARGVKDAGGVMDVVSHELQIEGPADSLPEHLEVDVTELGIHEHVNAGDVKLPKGLKLVTPADTIVVTVEASKTARQLEEAEAGITAEQPQPEVIGETPQE